MIARLKPMSRQGGLANRGRRTFLIQGIPPKARMYFASPKNENFFRIPKAKKGLEGTCLGK
jgi:hypothetical protein